MLNKQHTAADEFQYSRISPSKGPFLFKEIASLRDFDEIDCVPSGQSSWKDARDFSEQSSRRVISGSWAGICNDEEKQLPY